MLPKKMPTKSSTPVVAKPTTTVSSTTSVPSTAKSTPSTIAKKVDKVPDLPPVEAPPPRAVVKKKLSKKSKGFMDDDDDFAPQTEEEPSPSSGKKMETPPLSDIQVAAATRKSSMSWEAQSTKEAFPVQQQQQQQASSRAPASAPASSRFMVNRHEPLGSGGFGVVYKGVDVLTMAPVAIKESLLPPDQLQTQKRAMQAEFDLLKTLGEHPNIVRMIDLVVDDEKSAAQIVMEWMPSGSVASVIKRLGYRLHENAIRRFFFDALSGLAFLHSKGVQHRDIKPANMLVGSSGSVKLSDFGTSTENAATATTTRLVGTPAYIAPESLQCGKYSQASDIWAMACSVVEMATGKSPWAFLPEEQQLPMPLMFYIGTAQPPNHHPAIPDTLSSDLRDILVRCFAKAPADRPTAEALLRLPYFVRGSELPSSAEPVELYQRQISTAFTTPQGSSSIRSDWGSSEVTDFTTLTL